MLSSTKGRTSLLGFVLTIFVALSSVALAQNASLSGYVSDASSKETLISATVMLQSTKYGAITTKAGYYVVSDIPPGSYIVKVTYIGYQPFEQEIVLSANQSKRLDIELQPADVNSDAVHVVADRADDDRQISISRVNIPVEQLSDFRIGGETDIFRTLQYLPGVLTSSQISSGLYIRGGSPDQNLILLDGSSVYNPTHLFGFFSTFNTEAIKDVDLSKGGFPAEYGTRLSAVLDLTQKDGNKEEFEGVGSIGTISSKVSMQGPVGDGSFFIGGRRTYLELLKTVVPEDTVNPLPDYYFYDLNGKIMQVLGDDDRIYLSGFMTQDDLEIQSEGLGFNIGIQNQIGALRWTHLFSEKMFSAVNLSTSFYENGFTGNSGGFQFEVGNSIQDYSLRASLDWFYNDDITFKTGLEATRYSFDYFQNFTGERIEPGEDTDSIAGSTRLEVRDYTAAWYGQTNWQVNNQLSVQAGLRFDYMDLRELMTFDPRLALSYQHDDFLTLKVAWGIYHQYLRLASNPDFTFFDTWLPTDSTVDPGDSQHYIVSAEMKPFRGIDVNVDVYYKTLNNISELRRRQTNSDNVNEVFFFGDGEAYGAELFIQKKTGRLTGWLGYALGTVNAQFDSINGGKEFRPKYDRRHDFKVVAQYELSETWEVGASFSFQSGQSYTGATSRFQANGPGENVGVGVIVPAERYGLRLPPSHQLNLSGAWKTTIFGLDSRLLIDIYNVYSRQDIWFRYYDTTDEVTEVTDVRLLPIIPSFALEIKF